MQFTAYVVGLALLTTGCVIGLIGWLDVGPTRRDVGRRAFAWWGDLARYGGPALACFGAIVSFIDFGG